MVIADAHVGQIEASIFFDFNLCCLLGTMT